MRVLFACILISLIVFVIAQSRNCRSLYIAAERTQRFNDVVKLTKTLLAMVDLNASSGQQLRNVSDVSYDMLIEELEKSEYHFEYSRARNNVQPYYEIAYPKIIISNGERSRLLIMENLNLCDDEYVVYSTFSGVMMKKRRDLVTILQELPKQKTREPMRGNPELAPESKPNETESGSEAVIEQWPAHPRSTCSAGQWRAGKAGRARA